jgi:hemoglobin
MRETLFEFLCGWLGGPRIYFERANAKCLMSAHTGFAIDRSVADQWLLCMRRALNKLDAPEATREYIGAAFTRVCAAMVNR